MKIREMIKSDVTAVSKVCIEAFDFSVAQTVSEQGIETFKEIASCDEFLKRMAQDNVILVAEKGSKVVGVIELKEGRHLAMLFVSPQSQKEGIGIGLFKAALAFTKTDILTVSASLPSIPAYLKYGFELEGEKQTHAGLVFQPMQMHLN